MTDQNEELGIRKVEMTKDGLNAELSVPKQIALALAGAFLDLLDDMKAENYVETSCVEIRANGEDGRRVIVTARFCEGWTPHQLRRMAEVERDVAVDLLRECRPFVDDKLAIRIDDVLAQRAKRGNSRPWNHER